jgi:3-dehydroquinate synthase
LGALAASLYRRGCPLVLVPTTLLAGVDASVGGKTAIDQISRGRLIKNFAGTFYPAKKVWLSSDWWQSLPAEEVRSGLGECLKIYWLEGKTVPRKILQQIAQNKPLGKKGNQLLLSAVKAKLKYVKKDPYDNKGIREALNYGHTVGHALESLAKGRLTHGEAIAWGMWTETQWLGSDFSTEIYLVLEQLGFKFPHFLKKIKSDQWEVFLQQDKKVEQGKISCSILLKPKQQKKVRIDPKVLAKFCATLFAMAARRL